MGVVFGKEKRLPVPREGYVCDMVMGNELELANIIKFPLSFIVLSITKMAKSRVPYNQF